MREWLQRSEMLLGADALERLAGCHVMLLGLGGVGSWAAEALVRAGVGEMTIVDSDTVSDTNRNRQLPALSSTVGRYKTDVMAERLKDINPELKLHPVTAFYLPEEPVPLPENVSMVVDAIDTVSAKLHLAQVCTEKGVPLISCMGMGNRLDPSKIRVGDISETSGCPLCRVMRRELRKRSIPALRCVYSVEPAITPGVPKDGSRPVPGSVSFVPSAAGLFLAAEAVKMLIQQEISTI